MKNKPLISIIIPTYRASVNLIEIPLKSIRKQTCTRNDYEIIVVNNHWEKSNLIKQFADNYGAKFFEVYGRPSQACVQVNYGAKVANGKYILILDHDISLSKKLIQNFKELLLKGNENIDAWYIPYKIVIKNTILKKIRNFEEEFYTDSIIAAPRLIKRSTFLKTEYMYDPVLNSGPADWDLTLQLKLMNVRFGYLEEYFYHHEEHMSLFQFIYKKTIYSKGGELYKKKWKRKNKYFYENVVKKQYSAKYRLFLIFIENGRWRKLLRNMLPYVGFLFVKILLASIYFIELKSKRTKASAQ